MSNAYSHLPLFQQIAEYAIDNTGFRNNQLADQLELTPETFHKKLYVSRPVVEQELYEALLTTTHPVIVRGRCGSGKTSLVADVLRRLEENLLKLVFRIDFKALPPKQIAEWEKKDGEAQQDRIFDDIHRHLMARLQQYIDNHNIIWDDLLLQLVRHKTLTYEVDPDIMDARTELNILHQRACKIKGETQSFDSWLEEQTEQRTERVCIILDELRSKLTPTMLLQALTQLIPVDPPCKAVIWFDNVDSILNEGLRLAVRRFVRDYTKGMSEFAKIIVCLRPENSRIVMPDILAVIFTLIDNVDRRWETSGNDDTGKSTPDMTDNQSLEEELALNRQQLIYYQRVTEKRAMYLEECVQSDRADIKDVGRLEILRKRCQIVLEQRHVQDTLARLTNYDTRSMLVTLYNFVEYLDNETDINLNELEKRLNKKESMPKEARRSLLQEWGYRIESHLYMYLVGRNSLGGAMIFDPRQYNIVRWVMDWYQHEKPAVECMAQHLVLTSVYSSSGAKRNRDGLGRVYTKRVLDLCKAIGLRHDIASQHLMEFCKEVSSRQLTETARNYMVEEPETSEEWEADQHLPTPRATILLEAVAYKLHYLLALMGREEFRLGETNRPFTYNAQNSVTMSSIGEVLTLISYIGRMELDLLQQIQQTEFARDCGQDWFARYREEFGLRKMDGTYYTDERGSLLTENLLLSCQKFLATLQRNGYFGGVVTEAMVKEYADTRERFMHLVDSIARGKPATAVDTGMLSFNASIFTIKRG